MKQVKVVHGYGYINFNERLKRTTEEGWLIIPETFRVTIDTMAKKDVELTHIFDVLVEKDNYNENQTR